MIGSGGRNMSAIFAGMFAGFKLWQKLQRGFCPTACGLLKTSYPFSRRQRVKLPYLFQVVFSFLIYKFALLALIVGAGRSSFGV